MNDLFDVGIWAGVFIPLLFAIQYTLIADWWRRPTGRAIMALDACVFISRAPVALHRAGRLIPHREGIGDWIILIALTATPAVIAYLMFAFEKERRRAKARRAQHALAERKAKDEISRQFPRTRSDPPSAS